MRAAIFNGAELPITIETVPDPRPGTDELIVEVAACGICGSDVAMTSGSRFDYAAGKCFGHEYAGTVVAAGGDVPRGRIGERVACLPQVGCGRCEMCAEGRPLFCPEGRAAAAGFAEYVAVPARAAIPLPRSLSLADGALVEPIACGRHALAEARLAPGQRLLVIGGGSMAIAMIFWAQRLGAGRIVVASRSSHRREVLLAMGADAVHSFDEDDPAALTAALGGAPHVVAECIGKPGAMQLALDHVRIGGTVIAMGMCMTPEPLLAAACTFREARLIFPLAYSIAEFEETARAFDRDGGIAGLMVSDNIALERLPAAIAAIRAGDRHLKIQIDPRLVPAATTDPVRSPRPGA